MTRAEDFEARLARLAAETGDVRPRAGFSARVMGAIGEERDWSVQVLGWAKLGMALASAVAAACLFVAWETGNAADQEEAVAYGWTEVFE